MRLIIATSLAATLMVGAIVTAQSKPACNRACLTGFADTYLKALTANTPNAVPLADAFWDTADRIVYRFDIVNDRLGDVATEAVVQNSDSSKTMYMVRLKVADAKITEIETIRANKGEADRLWDPDNLKEVPPALQLSLRPADQDSYYGLIAAAEGYWRAFQTNGTEEYHPAALLPDARRFENGLQTTGMVRNGALVSAAEGFDKGRFAARNIWDRRYPVVDTERGIVLSIVRFGLKDGLKRQSTATTNDRLVAEFFAVKSGMIQEIHAVLFNLPDAQPTGWEPWYGRAAAVPRAWSRAPPALTVERPKPILGRIRFTEDVWQTPSAIGTRSTRRRASATSAGSKRFHPCPCRCSRRQA